MVKIQIVLLPHFIWLEFCFKCSYNSGGFQSGSSSTFAVNPPYAWECVLENPIEGYCWEVVIWQINLSQTATTTDFGDDGWRLGQVGLMVLKHIQILIYQIT